MFVALLDGKKILITGVLTDDSLAFGVAQMAQRQGAEIVLTGFGRPMRLTQRTARKLDEPVEVLELDVTNEDHIVAVREQLKEKWGRVDGALHSIGFMPEAGLGDNFFGASWDDVSVGMHVSAYSLRSLADIVAPLMTDGGSLLGLTFDGTVAWPLYSWMGVAKAALESLNRYLARELGEQQIRCNLVSAGPMRTVAARSIPGFSQFEERWVDMAPLGWDVTNSEGVAKSCVALLSDWFPQTTGSIIHVDGGYHAMGA